MLDGPILSRAHNAREILRNYQASQMPNEILKNTRRSSEYKKRL